MAARNESLVSEMRRFEVAIRKCVGCQDLRRKRDTSGSTLAGGSFPNFFRCLILFIAVIYLSHSSDISLGLLISRSAMMLSPTVLHCIKDNSDHYNLLGKLLILQAAKRGTSLWGRGSCFCEVTIVRSSPPLMCIFTFHLAYRPTLRGIFSMLWNV